MRPSLQADALNALRFGTRCLGAWSAEAEFVGAIEHVQGFMRSLQVVCSRLAGSPGVAKCLLCSISDEFG